MTAPASVKRLLVGRPLRSQQLHETLLPKWLALPVFASDPLSSVAYATEEIVLVLATGGAAYLVFAKWVAAAIAALLVIVVLSYRQTCHAYPSGGGAFAVSLDNFGENAALTAAAALLVDYVMTVAVSVVAGVVAITSAAPSLHRYAVALSVGFTVVLMLANLRGVQESGRAFAIPTYTFVALTYLMFLIGAIKGISGQLPDAATAGQQLQRTAHVGGIFTLLLVLRAFASGCTALTGVEAISNGVPAFRRPKARNAANTLAIMGLLAVSMFAGITVLALHLNARAQPSGNPSVISQIAASVFGGHAFLFYLYQAATAGILILAANTAFNGFPVLSSILAEHRYLPRQMHSRGDKLVFSNGIILLGGFAIALIVGFDANIDKLIQLYIIGVFTSFTLSQAGMVRHWNRTIPHSPPERRRRMRISRRDQRRRRRLHRCRARHRPVHQNRPRRLARHPGHDRPVRDDESHPPALRRGRRRTRPRRNRQAGAALPQPRDRARLPAAPADPAGHRLRQGNPARAPSKRSPSKSTTTTPPGCCSNGARTTIDIPLVVLDSPYREITRPFLGYLRGVRRRQPPRRHHRLHPRIRRRPMVGTTAAQPKRATAQDPAAVRTRRHGHQRALATPLHPAPGPTHTDHHHDHDARQHRRKPGNHAPPKPNTDQSRRSPARSLLVMHGGVRLLRKLE